MPEYIPQPQLPTALAQEVIRMAEKASIHKMLASSLGTIGDTIIKDLERRKQEQLNPRISFEQAQTMGLPSTVPQALPQGFQGPPAQVSSRPVFGNFPNPNIIKHFQGMETARAGFEGKERLAETKQSGDFAKTHTAITQEMLNSSPELKKMGAQVGQMFPNQVIINLAKPPEAPKPEKVEAGQRFDAQGNLVNIPGGKQDIKAKEKEAQSNLENQS